MTHKVKLKKLCPRGSPKTHWVWVLRYLYPGCNKEASEVIGWYAPIRDPWQPQRCKGPRLTEKQAQEVRTQRRNDLREGRIGLMEQPPESETMNPSGVDFSTWRQAYIQETQGTVRVTTLREIKRAMQSLDTLIGPKTAKAVDHNAVKRFIQARLNQKAQRSTVWKDISSLRRVWYDAHLEPNPWADPKLRKLLKSAPKGWHWYQPEEFRRMMEQCEAWRNRMFKKSANPIPQEQIRHRQLKWLAFEGMIGLAYTGGLRLGEIEHLAWSDVHFDCGEIEVAPKAATDQTVVWNPKDNERRIVPLVPTIRVLMEELRKTAGDGNPYVFVSDDRYRYILAHKDTWPENRSLINNIRRDFLDLCEASHVPQDEFHSLRKSCCTNLLEGGVAPHAVQKIMGHADLETTIKYYSKVRRDQITAARDVSEAYLSSPNPLHKPRIKTA